MKEQDSAISNELFSSLKSLLSDYDFVESTYVYGSYLQNPESAHDIDLLIIVRNGTKIYSLKALSDRLRSLSEKIEPTVMNRAEAENFIHQSLSSFYFFNLHNRSLLVYGKDLVGKLPKPTLVETFFRVAFIVQRLRNAIVDNDLEDIGYFKAKLDKWIPYFVQESLYVLYAEYVANPKEAFEALYRHVPELSWFRQDMDFSNRTVFLDELESILYSAFSELSKTYDKNTNI
ncbi:MAG: hypothetical protein ACP5RP_02445 [Candidatus Micrarchaeia archaeon]